MASGFTLSDLVWPPNLTRVVFGTKISTHEGSELDEKYKIACISTRTATANDYSSSNNNNGAVIVPAIGSIVHPYWLVRHFAPAYVHKRQFLHQSPKTNESSAVVVPAMATVPPTDASATTGTAAPQTATRVSPRIDAHNDTDNKDDGPIVVEAPIAQAQLRYQPASPNSDDGGNKVCAKWHISVSSVHFPFLLLPELTIDASPTIWEQTKTYQVTEGCWTFPTIPTSCKAIAHKYPEAHPRAQCAKCARDYIDDDEISSYWHAERYWDTMLAPSSSSLPSHSKKIFRNNATDDDDDDEARDVVYYRVIGPSLRIEITSFANPHLRLVVQFDKAHLEDAQKQHYQETPIKITQSPDARNESIKN